MSKVGRFGSWEFLMVEEESSLLAVSKQRRLEWCISVSFVLLCRSVVESVQ